MKRYIVDKNTSRVQPDPSGLTAEQRELKKEMHSNSLRALDWKRANYSKSKRKVASDRNKRKKARKQQLEKYSKQLEDNLPKSEAWFRELYLKEVFERKHTNPFFKDRFNVAINNRYIPDVSNRGYRYIIEIDGSWHDRADVIMQDIKKDHYFKKRGYLVIRIKDKDLESYKAGMEQLRAHIIEMEKTISWKT